MPGRFQRHQTIIRRTQQLEQLCISRSIFTERTGATQDLALLIKHRHHMTLGSNVDSRKPHHLTSFLHSVAPASEPELALLLVHARTPFAPLDTVRALSPGRGRQSSAQGFSFSTAGGDTSPGNLPHLNRSHSLVGSPRRRRWPGKRVLARLRRSSRLRISDSNPLPTPRHIFSSASRFGERPREKMFSSSFTMSEQQHRQGTLYKHAAPAHSGRFSLWHVLPPAPLAHLEICARPSCSRCKGRAEKNGAVMKSKTQHALPD